MNHLEKRIASALENKQYFHRKLMNDEVSQEAYDEVEKYYFDLLEERKRREEKWQNYW